MKRILKFRAWHKELNDMTFSQSGVSAFWFKIDTYPDFYNIMQFTGLKSKNGNNDVYEGDIFESNQNRKRKYKIVWSDKHCSFMGQSLHDNNVFELSQKNKLIIIGNIYTNPELIPLT